MSPVDPIHNDDHLTSRALALANGVWPKKDKAVVRRVVVALWEARHAGNTTLAADYEGVLRAVVYNGQTATMAAQTGGTIIPRGSE